LNLSDQAKHALRTSLAEAICVSQVTRAPRSRLERMRYSLLCHALLALDCDSGLDEAMAVRIAVHALIEWRGALTDIARCALP